MIIDRMRFDADGDLLEPQGWTLQKNVPFGDQVTLDPGHWHRVRLDAFDPRRLDAMARTLQHQLAQVPELRVLRCSTRQMDSVDGRVHNILDVIYCVPARG